MTDKDLDEMLTLLRKIDLRLKDIQFKNARDKIYFAAKDDLKVFGEAFASFISLLIQIYIIVLGYNYLTTTKTELPAVAVVGIIGIAFIILNSIITTSRNIYSSYTEWSKLKRSIRVLRQQTVDPLKRIEQVIFRLQEIDPYTSKKDIESIEKDWESISDALLRALSKTADDLTAPEFAANIPSSNNEHRDVRRVGESP